MMLTHCGNNVRNRYSGCVFSVKDIVPIPLKTSRNLFLPNNLTGAPSSVCELYRCRWSIETFFREIKQTLNLCDFLGHSANAVRWQVWTALLLYVLMRFQAYLSRWEHSFTRLFTMVRGGVWDRFDVRALLDFYGTANDLTEDKISF